MATSQPRRPGEEADSETMTVSDLPDQIGAIVTGGAWPSSDRQSIRLVTRAGLRITLHVMHARTKIPEHHVEGPISVHVLQGRIRFSADSAGVELKAGQLLTLAAETPHAVEAVEQSTFLVTVASGGGSPA